MIEYDAHRAKVVVSHQVLHPREEARGPAVFLAVVVGEQLERAALQEAELELPAPPRVIDDETGEEIPFGFWPDAVLGFNIASFLARGLMPAVRVGDLPVIVNPPPVTVTVEPTLAYWVEPTTSGGVRTLREAETLFSFQGRPVLELERSEPFELVPREYVLAAKIIAIQNVTSEQTFDFTVSSTEMQVLDSGLSALAPTTPLSGAGYSTAFLPPNAPPNTPPTVIIDRDSVNGLSKFFTVGAATQSKFTARINAASRVDGLIEIENLAVRPNAKEEATPGSSPPALTKLVPPGVNVTDRHVVLSVNLSVQQGSNVRVTLQNALVRGAVRNDETYEEYLRVLIDAQNLLDPSNEIKQLYATTAPAFLANLTAHGHGDDVLRQHGSDLWTFASGAVQGLFPQGTLQDDRQLYIVRLLCIGAIRAYAKRNKVTGVDDIIKKFELPSRGLDQATGAIPVDATLNVRKAIVTGFDPFGTVETRTRGNPSGLIALWFSAKTVSAGQSPVHVRTAVFPVRYKEFGVGVSNGWVEAAVDSSLQKIVMLMTCSENAGRDVYDIERWAGKNRIRLTDNNGELAPGAPVLIGSPPQVVQGLLDPIGNVTGATQFLESTLPYERVITRHPATRGLRGPTDSAAATDTTPFVTDQSYEIVETSATTLTPGEFRPEPLNASGDDSFIKQLDSPNQNKTALQGSGGNYLSNEIFYRTALRRNNERSTLNSGHFHIPSFVSSKAQNPIPEAPQRQRLIEGAGKAIRVVPSVLLPSHRRRPQVPRDARQHDERAAPADGQERDERGDQDFRDRGGDSLLGSVADSFADESVAHHAEPELLHHAVARLYADDRGLPRQHPDIARAGRRSLAGNRYDG